jgi:GT2 family glycosyltransferase
MLECELASIHVLYQTTWASFLAQEKNSTIGPICSPSRNQRVLHASHDRELMRQTCPLTVWTDSGPIRRFRATEQVLSMYHGETAGEEKKTSDQHAPVHEETTLVSVIIPVFNGATDLDRCLSAVHRSDWPTVECVVVDDASTDQRVADIALQHGVQLERMEQRGGPATARNVGVKRSRGEVLFFTDADVLLHSDAISEAMAVLDTHPDVAAVFGSYDDMPDDDSFLSRYRNLYHHWNHQVANAEASTFWTGCGAVRRKPFVELGGFSADYKRPSIEDIELGYRLREAGYRIRLLKAMLGTHLKHWDFWDMVRTDIFRRGAPWVALLRQYRSVPADLNLNSRARIATISAALLALSLVLLPISGHGDAIVPVLALFVAAAVVSRLALPPQREDSNDRWRSPLAVLVGTLPPLLALITFPDVRALLPLLLIAAIVWAQKDFYRLLVAHGGAACAIAAVPLQWVFFMCCAFSVPLGLLAIRRKK